MKKLALLAAVIIAVFIGVIIARAADAPREPTKEELQWKAQFVQAQLIIMEKDNQLFQIRIILFPNDKDMIQGRLVEIQKNYEKKQVEFNEIIKLLQTLEEAKQAPTKK